MRRRHADMARLLDLFAPSMGARGEREREQRGVYERAAASPSLAAAVIQAVVEIDVSDVVLYGRTRYARV